MQIPVQNIYFLLSYAWNKLDERDIVAVDPITSNNILDLFAKVLVNGMSYIMRRGLDRGYVAHVEETSRLRGRIDFCASIHSFSQRKPSVVCEYDELSYDILHNQIIRTMISRLLLVREIDKDIRADLRGIEQRLHHVSIIPLEKKHFSMVQLHSNNFFYDFLLKVCELVYENLLISEETGGYKFRDFLRESKAMARLFEEFVRNFYKRELSGGKVGCEIIQWQVETVDAAAAEFLPEMRTDVSLTWPGRKIIIDTKYYSEVFQSYYDKETLKSANMYQIYAYVSNVEEVSASGIPAEGILLYPTVEKPVSVSVKVKGHKLSVRTINLNQDWKQIHEDLMSIVA